MKKYTIVTDCTCDLSLDLIDRYDIKVIPMEFTIDDEKHLHSADFKVFKEIKFYDRLRNGSMASTSQINPFTYTEFLTPYLEAGNDILYVAFSSGLSSTYESSVIAINELTEKFPERKIITIDSLAASAGEGLMVYYACLNREQGMTIEENKEWLESHVQNFAHWFTVDDLHHLKRGGRVSAATAIVGSALSIKPVLHVDETGHLVSISKAHGRKKSLSTLAQKLKDTILEPKGQVIMISHGDCLEDAQFLKDKIIESVPVADVIISDIGPVIGAHSGPGTVALFYFGKSRY
ncbi:DegV family protein with EDD domain [Breznakia sp. PF5-3]|uniref:DegV family protein n=1 Tax=unclassified Breznakia TaxID=2623764 RepID=UPI002406C706|nr:MULTISPECIES: DegV family protein [unclassified Breznakia]MDF9824858.1 DegV family protein with EDD domain [Breznakia sp. PM6-1]MDF9835715.1 DegV family protein with EDD domain [Breznakia sp. PF5-3]MDF9838275.1 DegV family protein with EDD domain [Breznakia sp. PFB2-8]MDF9860286.1 DegV family protein with EDD domain [Breznakia sp. PH5-24]